MALPFYGPWRIEVASKDADYSQRYVIAGSAGSDGAHVADITTPPVLVDGAAWTISLEWNDNAGSGWLPSDVRKSASNTLAEGLVVTLGADDNYAWYRDGDYNDVVLRLYNQDPTLNPWVPFPGLPDFTVHARPRDPQDGRPPQSDKPRPDRPHDQNPRQDPPLDPKHF
jgi:hypothetical protein